MSKKLFVYRAARLAGLFALCRVLTRSRVRILCYHAASMGDESGYNPLLFMSAVAFRRRIGWLLRKQFGVVTLDRAIDMLEGKEPVARLPTVITFDDGWYSTAAYLAPILAETRMPATLYLCTSHFLEGWPVLGVVVNYLIWKCGLKLIEVEGIDAAIDGRYRLDDARGRSGFHGKACAWLDARDALDARATVVARIERLAGAMNLDARSLALETGRFSYVSADELRSLERQGCSIELHGHVHRYPAGDPHAFKADLQACSGTIVGLGLPQPRHYCYPSGSFDENAAGVLEAEGVRTATTCIPGLVGRKQTSRRYFLPRFLDGENIDPLVFEAEMSGFAHFVRWVLRR